MLANKRMDKGRSAASSVTLDSLIPEDHIIRKIDAAIDWEGRCAPMRAWYNRDRGRHAFEPEVLLAIALWRHIYGVDSLRAAAAEMQTNLPFRWFIGCPLDQSVPHFSTVNANLLHRIPKDVFEAAFAGALCDIIDGGVFPPDVLVHESACLTENGQLGNLSSRYFVAMDQLSLAPESPEEPKQDSTARQMQLTL
jgi:transposase